MKNTIMAFAETQSKSKKANLDEMKKFFYEELEKKDQIIENLKKEKELLMNTALKQSQRVRELQDELAFVKTKKFHSHSNRG